MRAWLPPPWARLSLTVAVVGAVLAPAIPGSSDGFPLSTYPMFGYARAPVTVIETALGVTADGRRVPLRPWHIGGTGQAKYALSTARAAISQGDAPRLCTEVAARVAERPPRPDLSAIEIVRERWATDDAVAPRLPSARRTFARCPVP